MRKKTLRLMILEDNPDDAELSVRQLERDGFIIKWSRVETEQAFREALDKKPDLILADYALPSFDGMAALRIKQKIVPEIPLIIISGTIGEEIAVECMKSGAADYVLKDRLFRLGPVVKRALEEGEAYRARSRAEEKIKHFNLVLRSIRGVNQLIVKENDRDRLIQGACDRLTTTRGYHSAWVVLIDESQRLVAAAESGLGNVFLPIVDGIKRGELPECGRRALKQSGVYIIEEMLSACADCPRPCNSDKGAMSARLEYGGKIYGFMTVSLPSDFTKDKEDIYLFEEVVGDIAFALYSIELDEARKWAEEELRESEKKFKSLIESLPVGVLVSTPEGGVHEINAALWKIYGYDSKKEFLKVLTDSHYYDPKDRGRFVELHKKGLVKGFELRFKRKDGSVFWGSVTSTKRTTEDGTTEFINVFEDITERKKAEDRIKASLKEKEVLLKEIHHRVKNNLQIISSLLNLQAGYVKSKQAREVFKESQDRVRSMALIHEKLYQSKDFANIDLAEYIQSLTSNLFHTYQVNPGAIRLQTDIKDISLGIDTAVPCGLLINELITNAMKHAFPDGRKGKIRISFQSDDEKKYTLIIEDDGIGLPKDLDIQDSKTLGLQLIKALVEQLDGTMEVIRKGGTTFKIVFKEHEYKQRI